MKRSILVFSLIFFFSVDSFAQSKVDEYLDVLSPKIKVSFAFQSLDHDFSLFYRADKKVPSASLIKIPILVVLLQEVAKGKLDLDQLHYLDQNEIVGGAGEIQFSEPGKKLSLKFLAQEMMRVSDNTATNILIKYLGISEINHRFQELNLHHTSLQRLMMDFKAIEEGRQNYTSMIDLVNILSMVWKNDLLTENLRTVFLGLLKNCEDKTMIPAAFPNYKTYNKTGTLDYIRGDAAILEGANNSVLAIAVEGFDDLSQAEDIVKNIALMLQNDIKIFNKLK
jgi:beta-lactamase class A